MFLDLNVPWPVAEPLAAPPKKSKKSHKEEKRSGPVSTEELADPLTALAPQEQQRLRELTHELCERTSRTDQVGYTTVAFEHRVHTKYDPAMHPCPFRLAQLRTQPPFPKLDPRTRRALSAATSSRGITQLSRMTLVLDKDHAIKGGTGFVASNSAALQKYDVLAVMPMSELAFQHACITMTELKPFSVDIISLDLAAAPRLPYRLKRSTVGAALANGAVFEITYSAALSSGGRASDDALDVGSARRHLFSGARELLRATNGRGVILSSAATDVMGLRGPYDVMNMYVARLTGRAALMGMTPMAAKDAISTTAKSLLIRARTCLALLTQRHPPNFPWRTFITRDSISGCCASRTGPWFARRRVGTF